MRSDQEDLLIGAPAVPELNPKRFQWSATDLIAAAGLFTFVLATNINTVLNNAYSFGSTLYDSAIFQTIIWRSGPRLLPAPVIVTNTSYLNFRFSPINYLPNFVSYFVAVDRMSYYGLVYGLVYASLVTLAFQLFLRLSGHRTLVAAIGGLVFYLSGPVNSAQWEPHQEIASALFTAGFFLAWGLRRRGTAATMIVLNAMVSEDTGMLLAFPLFLLWAHARRFPHKSCLRADRWTLLCAIFSALLSVTSFVTKRLFFSKIDVIPLFYYGAHPFAHLSSEVIANRTLMLIFHEQYLWLPGLVLAVAAIRLRDVRLIIGWAAFFPYWLFNFLSILELNAELGSYKAFPFILTMIWPAVVALRSPARRRKALCIVQTAVLLSASVSWEGGRPRIAPPSGIAAIAQRWILQPETEHAELYRAFESRLANGSLGRARASMGALALYPYSFPRWDQSEVRAGSEDEARGLDSILWFDGDRDQSVTLKWLERGRFPYFYRVIGTRLRLASRTPLDLLAAFAGAIEPTEPP